MKIFHGSLDIVDSPRIIEPNRNLDYGKGFYCTTSEKQANDWVQRRMSENNSSVGYINIYELNESRLIGLNCLNFQEPNEDWANFVLKNRTQKDYIHNYDVVYGPVANDKVYLQFGLWEAGAIGIDTLIRELKTYKLVDQYLFHTPESLKTLHFIEAMLIEK